MHWLTWVKTSIATYEFERRLGLVLTLVVASAVAQPLMLALVQITMICEKTEAALSKSVAAFERKDLGGLSQAQEALLKTWVETKRVILSLVE